MPKKSKFKIIYCAACCNCKRLRRYLDPAKRSSFVRIVKCSKDLWINGRTKDGTFDWHTLNLRVKYGCYNYEPFSDDESEVKEWLKDLFKGLPMIKQVCHVRDENNGK